MNTLEVIFRALKGLKMDPQHGPKLDLVFGGFLVDLGAVLGLSWGVLAASWGVLGASRGVLGASWGVLAASWGVLGRLWGVLGRFGRIWGIPGEPLDRRFPRFSLREASEVGSPLGWVLGRPGGVSAGS